MSVISERRAKARGEFISYREAIEKLAAQTGDSLADWAEELRAKKIHFTGGRRYKPGILVHGADEADPLGYLLEKTAETGEIPIAYDMFHEWGPDNVGWLRVALVENLNAAGLPAPASLLEPSPEYVPRRPPPAPAVEHAATAPLQSPESSPESEAPVTKSAIDGAIQPATEAELTWQEQARVIADELDAIDAKAGAHDSKSNIADRVAKKMRLRGIEGPRGPLTGKTVMREALQGQRWKPKR